MANRSPWTVVYHDGVMRRELLADTNELRATQYAESESYIYRNAVSLWYGPDLVAAFDWGVQRELTQAEYTQVITGK